MTLDTAMIFEKSFDRAKAQKKLIRILKSVNKASILGQNDASRIKKLVVKRYGENSRHSEKFMELAT